MNKEEYLKDPCGASSLPYYKMKSIEIPKQMLIINDKEYEELSSHEYIDELYFRLKNDLKDIKEPIIPAKFSIVKANDEELSKHINSCYKNISISQEDIRKIKSSEMYDEELFVAVKDNATNKIAATGIAVFDREIKEGVLEWIQVSEDQRRKGLGEFIVNYLLFKLSVKADFVTVSGKVYNKDNAERLYRKCGFTGDDIWHILRKK